MRILSGIKPTGKQSHIGNYFGMIEKIINLQDDDNEILLFIANYHALTTQKNKEILRQQTKEIIKELIAFGFNGEKNFLFLQSDIPEVTELCWIMNNIAPMGLLERAHAYKDYKAKDKKVNVGIFDYPVLQASDILIYNSDIVPVGKDQKQHVEIARDLALKFNDIYGDTFVVPRAMIDKKTQTVLGTDGRKMSKSYGNTINIFEDKNMIYKSIKQIKTDSKKVNEPKNPEECLVFKFFELISSKKDIDDLSNSYKNGKIGYKEAKDRLYENFMNYFKDARKKYESIKNNKTYINNILERGKEHTRGLAIKNMRKIRKRVGLINSL